MPDFIGLHKSSEVDATDAPGQTFVNFFGDGGSYGGESDRELCQDREPFDGWYRVSRPPAVDQFGGTDETEYVVTRIGGNDVVPHASRNLAVQRAVRAALARDLAEGEFVYYTGNGTAECYVDFEPDGTVTLANDDGGGNTVTITMEPSTGHLDLDTSGTVRIGAAAATDYVTLFTALKSEWDANVTIYNAHTHPTAPVGPVSGPSAPMLNLTNTPRATKGRAI